MTNIDTLYANFKSGQIDQETFVKNIESLVGSGIDMPGSDIGDGSLDKRIAERDSVIEQQMAQLASAKNGFDKLQEKKDKLKEQKTKLQEQKRDLSSQLEIKTTELGQATIEINKLKEVITTKENEVQTLESEISTLRVKYNTLEGYTGNASDLIEELEKQIKNLEEDILRLKDEQQSLDVCDDYQTTLQGQIDRLNSAMQECRDQLDGLKNNGWSLLGGVRCLAGAFGWCETTADKIVKLENNISEKQQDKDGFISQQKKYESTKKSKKTELQSEIDKKKQSISGIRNKLAGYKRSPKYQAEQQIKAKEKKLTQLESEIEQNKKTLKSTTNRVKELEQERDELVRQCEENQNELDALKEELEEAQGKLQEAHDALGKIAVHLSDKITGETKEVVLGAMRERLQLWQSLPTVCQPETLTFEIESIDQFTGTLDDFIEQVRSLQNEIDIKIDNQAELARMEKLAVDGILSDRITPFVNLPTREHGEGGSFSVMYQIGKNPESLPLEVAGSPMYFTQQVATKIINQTFDEIQQYHNWIDKKRQSVELEVICKFNDFLKNNPDKSSADYLNELAQIVRLARADGNKPQFSQDAVNELKTVLIQCGVEKGGNIDGLCNISISQALNVIDGQFGKNWCESQLKDFLGAIKTFCQENNLDYDRYMSEKSFSTFTDGTNFVETVKSEVTNVNERKQEAASTMQSIVDGIVKNGIVDFNSVEINWHRFAQLQKDAYSEPRLDYQATIDNVKWLASQITDIALQQIGQENGWASGAIANVKKWVVEKFNESVNPQGGQKYNVLFDRLSQLIRTTRINSSILTQEARKELQDVTVMCGVGGPDVRVIVRNSKKLNKLYGIPISQAIDVFNQSGFFPKGLQLQNFLGAIQNFCVQNGLDFEQCKRDVALKTLINGTDFLNKCSTEIDQVKARKQEAISVINWIAETITRSDFVPDFPAIKGQAPNGSYIPDLPIVHNPRSLNGMPSLPPWYSFVTIGRLFDICHNPFDEPRVRALETIEQEIGVDTAGLDSTLSLITECVMTKAGINDLNARNDVLSRCDKFLMKNGASSLSFSELTPVDCVNQIASLIKLRMRRAVHLPQSIFTNQQQYQEVINIFMEALQRYAMLGGNLYKLYQMPIEQAVDVLYNADPTMKDKRLKTDFLFPVQLYCSKNFGKINIQDISISYLSLMQ